MSYWSRAKVDMQFLFGDTLIKTGSALIKLTFLVGIITPFTLREAVMEGMVGYLAMLAGVIALAIVFWRWGRIVRREANIADS